MLLVWCGVLIQYLLIVIALSVLGTGERVINKIWSYHHGAHRLVGLVINIMLET